MIYPCILVVAATGSIFLLLTRVLPQFVPLFAENGVALPPSTAFLLGLGNVISDYGLLGLVVTIAGVVGAKILLDRPGLRLAADSLLLRLPVVGGLVKDVLAARLQALPSKRGVGVSNQGIGGNHLLTDGLGPNALARFDRDVLAVAGVRWVIVFEGVNDLGGLARNGEVTPDEHAALVKRVLAAYEQMILRGHAHGLRVMGATITPYVGSDYYHAGALSEADRQAVNAWIRAAGHFDGVIDFDSVVRDPQHPDRLPAGFDCGDHLHPSPAGYKAMGESIPLSLFAQ